MLAVLVTKLVALQSAALFMKASLNNEFVEQEPEIAKNCAKLALDLFTFASEISAGQVISKINNYPGRKLCERDVSESFTNIEKPLIDNLYKVKKLLEENTCENMTDEVNEAAINELRNILGYSLYENYLMRTPDAAVVENMKQELIKNAIDIVALSENRICQMLRCIERIKAETLGLLEGKYYYEILELLRGTDKPLAVADTINGIVFFEEKNTNDEDVVGRNDDPEKSGHHDDDEGDKEYDSDANYRGASNYSRIQIRDGNAVTNFIFHNNPTYRENNEPRLLYDNSNQQPEERRFEQYQRQQHRLQDRNERDREIEARPRERVARIREREARIREREERG